MTAKLISTKVTKAMSLTSNESFWDNLNDLIGSEADGFVLEVQRNTHTLTGEKHVLAVMVEMRLSAKALAEIKVEFPMDDIYAAAYDRAGYFSTRDCEVKVTARLFEINSLAEEQMLALKHLWDIHRIIVSELEAKL